MTDSPAFGARAAVAALPGQYIEPRDAEHFERSLRHAEVRYEPIALQALGEAMINRIRVLEAALAAFASRAAVMATVRSGLDGQGRYDQPAGGVWFTVDGDVTLLPVEDDFRAALDAFGRERAVLNLEADCAVISAGREVAGGATIQ